MKKIIHNRKYLKQIRKDLRNHLTPAEATLWKQLQQSKLGQKFRRQHSVGNYVLDFYCPASKLNVELDGKHHYTEEGIEKDKKRDAYLRSLNITTLRFENEDVFEKLPDVLMKIKKCFVQPTTPAPPETGGEL
jgi:very-short-patch-repair endonuclease